MKSISAGTKRIIIAITGASGSAYGVELLRALSTAKNVETHLVVSSAGYLTLSHETTMSRSQIESMANVVYADRDIGAAIASGSFETGAMIIAPCSMKTLASIATGVTGRLVARAADVVLKERRRLVLLPRETPLNLVHLRNMITVTEMGAIVYPPVPAFYSDPKELADIVQHTAGRVLSLCDVDNCLAPEWQGL